ncbi:Rqc2 family fibronectin-binding protein [Prochlorococcus marinus]|uniref:Rqc2 family fibronectin-binding protein n=1 Tax=Prochlorococcus marinus TaxID=1219 RepID=UPI0022B523EB|nr:NFACT RNA binding domain-containing protein [Prochlorococcus marinus]
MNKVPIQLMDLTTLKAVVFELSQDIVPSRFENAQQTDSQTLQLGFRTLEKLTWIEISWLAESPRIVQIPPPKRHGEKSTLAKQLKHLLVNLALLEIQQNGFERIVRFRFSSRPGKEIEKEMVVELMGRHSNIILLDKSSKVITLGKQIKEKHSRLRPIGTGDLYKAPPPLKGLVPKISESFDSWKENICLVPSTFKNSLKDTYQGISPALTLQIASNNYNEAINLINQSVTSIELKQWEAIYKRWKEWLSDIENSNYTINFNSSTDFVVWGKIKSKVEKTKIGLSLGIYYSNKIIDREITSIREKLKHDLEKSKNDEIRKLEMQELLIKNISEYITMQNKANNILTLQSPTKKQIIESQSLFKEAKRKKRSRESILNRIIFHKKKISEIEYCELFLDSLMYEDNEANKNKLDSIIELKEEVDEYICIKRNSSRFKSNRKKDQVATIKEIQSPSGIKIQIGSNNRQNELISLRKGKKGDLWFHAQETPGSHIVLKSSNGLINEKDIQLAADLASFFSRGRGNKLTPIIMVPIENLQRISGSLPGTVSHRGGKVLWGKAERAEKYFHQK